MRNRAEWFLQKEFIHWLNIKGLLYCASAGGMRTSMPTAVKMKLSGYKKGFPDIFIYEPTKRYHGLAIELKVDSRTTPEQITWQSELEKRGYKALIMPKGMDFIDALEWLKIQVEEYLQDQITPQRRVACVSLYQE